MFEREEIMLLRDDVFRLLRDLIRDYCGIYFEDSSKYILERRLTRRVRSLNLDNFRDYYRYLLYDRQKAEEMAAIMDILTVNETYFFREQSQLNALSDEILAELREKNKNTRRIRIWSAGCSSGEEPYTIAMLVLERSALFEGWDIEILGSDINQRVLQTARNGLYRKNSFRTTDDYFLSRYFNEEEGSYRIKDSVRKLVNFSHLNLLDPFKVKFVNAMDVVLCRNVLIYFFSEARKKVIENFYHRLNDGGYLLLGHAESLMNISTAFTLKHLKNDMVYCKPEMSALRVLDPAAVKTALEKK